jgi:hypothetical protein
VAPAEAAKTLLAAPSIADHVRLACSLGLSQSSGRTLSPLVEETLTYVADTAVGDVNRRREEASDWLRSFCADFPVGPGEWPRAGAFRALLQHFGYSDVGAADLADSAFGAGLTGTESGPDHWPEVAGCEPRDVRDLLRRAEHDPGFFTRQVKPSRFDAALWAKSNDEVAEGKAEGPFTDRAAVEAVVGGPFVAAHRFGVQQGDSLRPCDNMSGSGDHVNACFASSRKLVISDLDVFSASAAHIARRPVQGRSGRLSIWKKDHKSAYRQVPLRRDHRRFAVYCFCHPETGQLQYFVHKALPFGASASVYAYNRVAQALTFLAMKIFGVPVQNFFDDFWCAEPNETAESGFAAFSLLNELLGFTCKAAKDLPPSEAGELLGVWVRLGAAPFWFEVLPLRRSRLLAQLQEILDADALHGGAARKLAGKLQFACLALFGRVGRAPLGAVYARAARCDGVRLSPGLRQALVCLGELLRRAPPRLLAPGLVVRGRVVLYTDASTERGGFVSGVLFFDVAGSWEARFFGLKVPTAVRRLLNVRRQQIALLETIAVVVAFVLFRPWLVGVDVLLLVDNKNAVAWLRNGFARKDATDANFLVAAFWQKVLDLSSSVHVEWVPSKLNIADGPSRPSDPTLMLPLRNRHARRLDAPFPVSLLPILAEGFAVLH